MKMGRPALGRARAWLFSIVRRLVLEESSKRQGEPLEADVASEPLEAPDACGCILKQIDALPPGQATLLTRVVVEGASVAELAKELGITPNNAWVRLHRARRGLREQLRMHCGSASLRQCLDCGCIERGCCR